MPNHFHGIVVIQNHSTPGVAPASAVEARRAVPADTTSGATPSNPAVYTTTNIDSGKFGQGHGTPCPYEQFGKPVPGSIPTIIRSFKSAVTKRINNVWQSSGNTVWQRNYYDHIVRNETDLQRI